MTDAASPGRPVLLYAFRGEPVKSLLIGRQLQCKYGIVCHREDTRRDFGWNVDYAYEFDEQQFDALREAYESGDEQRLDDAWKPCKRIDIGKLEYVE